MPGPVRVANRADAGPLSASLARAFFDDPVMSFLVPHEPTRRQHVAQYFEVALTIQHLPHGASYTDTDRAGGALWDPPGHWKLSFGQIARGSPKLIAAFGLNVPRALRVLSAIERQHPRTPHWYLAVLGTDPIHQGKGIGSALLAPILERCDRDGTGAYLESSKESNIAFYRRHRFEVTGEIALPGGPKVWPMWRDPLPPEEG
ncbi:MAG TPA: GNAT family N-acetyltransferase [Acidimicrobiales bacterium]|nr:GNAT family N-acetyltransferase [Acidimicrobiales bacterium]